jgi:RNA polymerase sigma-70 factor (ECF subfamily)
MSRKGHGCISQVEAATLDRGSPLLPPVSSASARSSGTDKIDPQLLHDTQAYLKCRSQKQPPASASSTAWEEFYRLYRPLLRRFALACGVRQDELSDCLQEVWTELVKHLPDFHYDPRRGHFRAWLYTIVHSKAVDLIRRRMRHPTPNLSCHAEAALEGREVDPAADYERHCRQERVRQVLAELRQQVSASSYRVFHLRWIKAWSMREIAAELRLTPEQVRFRHHRLKQKFRGLWTRVLAGNAPGKNEGGICRED